MGPGFGLRRQVCAFKWRDMLRRGKAATRRRSPQAPMNLAATQECTADNPTG